MGIGKFDLRGVPLFRGLNGCELAGLLAAARQQEMAAGAVFFREQEAATRCYLLVSGHVKLVQAGMEGCETVVRFVGAGGMFGWVAVMGGTVFPGTAQAVTQCLALTWDIATVRQAVLDMPRLGLNALEALGGRLREAQDRLRELATERVEQRVARALLRLAEQAGHRTGQGVEIAFPVSRQLLADTAGATLHTVSRILATWGQSGVVGGSRQRVVVRQPDALRALADG